MTAAAEVRPDQAADHSVLRSALGGDSTFLVLAAIEPGMGGLVRDILKAVALLKERGVRTRLIIYGGSSALFSEGAARDVDSSGISFLEPWSKPVLPSVIRVVDLLIGGGLSSEKLITRTRELRPDLPILLHPSVTGDVGAAASRWDGSKAEQLAQILGQVAGIDTREAGGSVAAETDPDRGEARKEGGSLRPEGGADTNRVRGLRPQGEAAVGNYVLWNDWGLGDELLLSAVAREIRRAFPQTGVWIHSRYGFRFPSYVRRDPVPPDGRKIETIYQNPVLYGPEAHSPFPRHLVQQMLDKFALDTGLVVRAHDVRPELDLSTIPLVRRDPRSVILHTRPNRRLPSKDWGLGRWQELAERLRGEGVRLLQVGEKGEPLLEGAEDVRGASMSSLPGVFAEAGAAVSVVGFLMHLAQATRTPAVVIYGGREHPAIDGYPDQVHLSSGPLACRGRWGCHLAADFECSHGMVCMDAITPERVARETLLLLQSRSGEVGS